MVRPAAFLVLAGGGQYEITRVFFHNGGFRVAVGFGDSGNRLGPLEVLDANLLTSSGLLLSLSKGYQVVIPWAQLQATWQI